MSDAQLDGLLAKAHHVSYVALCASDVNVSRQEALQLVKSYFEKHRKGKNLAPVHRYQLTQDEGGNAETAVVCGGGFVYGDKELGEKRQTPNTTCSSSLYGFCKNEPKFVKKCRSEILEAWFSLAGSVTPEQQEKLGSAVLRGFSLRSATLPRRQPKITFVDGGARFREVSAAEILARQAPDALAKAAAEARSASNSASDAASSSAGASGPADAEMAGGGSSKASSAGAFALPKPTQLPQPAKFAANPDMSDLSGDRKKKVSQFGKKRNFTQAFGDDGGAKPAPGSQSGQPAAGGGISDDKKAEIARKRAEAIKKRDALRAAKAGQ